MQKICTIIPVYNEASRLDTEVFTRFVNNNKNQYLLFVNDGSNDNSIHILNTIINNPNTFIVNLKENVGKAEAIRQGVLWIEKNIKVDYFGYLDADLATPLSEVDNITSFFNDQGINIAFGSRIKLYGSNIERTLIRHYLGRLFATFVSIILKLDIYDTQCGAKYFRNNNEIISLFSNPFQSKWFFDIELFLRYKLDINNSEFAKSVKEIPLNTWIEKGNSKLKIMDFINTPFEIIKIHKHYRRSAN